MPLPAKMDQKRTRAAQVGFLMKAYRESFPGEDGRQGITQSDLLRRMASVNPHYGRRRSHGTVSRWESGVTAPTVARLEVFGKALNLAEAEIEGLILLAGLDPQYQESRTLTCPRCGGETATTHTQELRAMTGAGPATTAATRTRKCLACGHTRDSRERWMDSPEESDQGRLEQALWQIQAATDRIQRALRDVAPVHNPQPSSRAPRAPATPNDQDQQNP